MPPVPFLKLAQALCGAAALLAAAPPASAQVLTASSQEVYVQYGGNGSTQTVLRDPWAAAISLPPLWEASADLGSALVRAAALTSGAATANSYAGFNLSLQNTSAVPVPVLSASVSFDASFLQSSSGNGSLSQTVSAIWVVLANGGRSVARLDHQHFEICQNGDCRDGLTTAPYLEGGNTVSVLSATSSFVEAVLSVPSFTLAPGASAQFLFSLLPWADASGNGWVAGVDALHSAQAAMTLGAGSSVISAQPLGWISAVPEPGSAALSALGVLALLAWQGRHFRPKAQPQS